MAAIRVLALSGSLRKLSCNTALARYAAAAAPALGADFVVADLASLPMYNQDLEANFPAPALELRKLAASCDAIFFCSPEHNYSTAPVMSNAIAWLSRAGPEGKSPIVGKPAAIVSAGGGAGGLRSQMHLCDSVQFLDIKVLNKPEFTMNLYDGTQRFDKETGALTDKASQERLQAVVAALVAWTKQLAK